MKNIEIQIQKDHRNVCITQFITALIRLPDIKTIKIHKGPKNHKYVNISIPVRSIRKTWNVLRPKIRKDPVLSRTSIVVGEGKHGWDDYELMYHWDADEIDKKWRKIV